MMCKMYRKNIFSVYIPGYNKVKELADLVDVTHTIPSTTIMYR